MVNWLRNCAYYSGVLWLTPLVGKIDRADLEYLRSCIFRDLEWGEEVLRAHPNRAGLDQACADLAALIGITRSVGQAKPREKLAVIVHPWDVSRGWTDYGAIRTALIRSLPIAAHAAALAEIRLMKAIVIRESQARWMALAEEVDESIRTNKNDQSIPDKLQALWREVDFGRNHQRVRVSKMSTIQSILWFLILAFTLLTTWMIADRAREEPALGNLPDPWLIVVFGLLGGAVSALRNVRLLKSQDARRAVEPEAMKLRLRPVVGAMAALVLYCIIRSGLVVHIGDGQSDAKIQIRVDASQIFWVYCVLAFLAGFSERLLVGMLSTVEQVISGNDASDNGSGGSKRPDPEPTPDDDGGTAGGKGGDPEKELPTPEKKVKVTPTGAA